MPDMGSISALLSGINTAKNIAQSMLALKTAVEINSKVIELQHAILTAQGAALDAKQDHLSLIERISELEKQVAEYETWEETKQRYELYEAAPGVFVYALKPECHESEKPHWICAKCYNDRKASIIQQKSSRQYTDYYICFECKNEFHITRRGFCARRIRSHAPRAMRLTTLVAPSQLV